MDLEQAGSATPGRTEAFHDGVNGTPAMVASGLSEQSAMFNSKVPGQFTPHSVLQGLPGMSGNGMSDQDRQRVMPGGYTLPANNGLDPSEAATRMRLMGRNTI